MWVVWATNRTNILWIDSLFYSVQYTFIEDEFHCMNFLFLCVYARAHFSRMIFRQNVKLTRQKERYSVKYIRLRSMCALLRWELKSNKFHSMWVWAWKIILYTERTEFIEGVSLSCVCVCFIKFRIIFFTISFYYSSLPLFTHQLIAKDSSVNNKWVMIKSPQRIDNDVDKYTRIRSSVVHM